MTAKEKLIERVARLSEEEAGETLELLESRTARAPSVDSWSDLDSWSDAAGKDSMRMLDQEEAAIGFAWTSDTPS